jgi:hypothetical protein
MGRPIAILTLVLAFAAGAGAYIFDDGGPSQAGATTLIMIHSRTVGPISGRIPNGAIVNGVVDWADVPKYVSVAGPGDSVLGYVLSADINPSTPQIGPLDGGTYTPVCGADGIKVYDQSLMTVIGAIYPGAGYVPTGSQPQCTNETPTTVG